MYLDPITLEVMLNSFFSIVDEMEISLVKSAYSTNIKDRMDCSTAIYKINDEVVAQTELGAPIHLGTMSYAIPRILNEIPVEEMDEGDVIILNDPYPAGPGHLCDMMVVSPVFYKNDPVALLANQAHHVDIGGYAPGSMPYGVDEIYQEGLRIPPTKIIKKGKIQNDIVNLIKRNTRTEREFIGDFSAQVAACKTGEQRLHELFNKNGSELTLNAMDDLILYSENLMRKGIKDIPNGKYEFEDFVEGDGFTKKLIKIHVSLEIKDDEIIVDFSKSDKQVRGPVNGKIGNTAATVYFVVKTIVNPDIPANRGVTNPIKIIAPEGSFVNASFPAAISNSNIITTQRIADVLFGTFIQALPERCKAACAGTMNIFNIGGIDPRTGRYYSYVETYAGGQGASPVQDGMDGVQTNMTNTRNAPAEALEISYPFFIEKYGLRPDTEGAGTYRGGMGVIRVIKLLDHDATITFGSDRNQLQPWGVFGGLSAKGAECQIVSPDGNQSEVFPKSTFKVKAENKVYIKTPGGGGWGPPSKRDKKLVYDDIKLGLISQDRANKIYDLEKNQNE